MSSVPLAFASALEWFKGSDGIGTVSFVALSAIGYLLAMYGRMPDEFNVAGHSAKFTTEQRLEVQAVLDEMSARQLEEIACDGSDEMRELASDALDFRDRARAYLEQAATLVQQAQQFAHFLQPKFACELRSERSDTEQVIL